ncbi:hypothetical protein RIF29_30914 [Crotalaria pallida]|uniref:Uncharacterized protein n=1 Tax=Crotalaria pallida TaxID=3830 RepID=A0AAN9ENL8_CROPI
MCNCKVKKTVFHVQYELGKRCFIFNMSWPAGEAGLRAWPLSYLMYNYYYYHYHYYYFLNVSRLKIIEL